MKSSLVARSLFVVFMILLFVPAASAQTPRPVLVTEPLSTRAVALDSSTFTNEPFRTTPPVVWNGDGRTRISLFVMNVALQAGEDLSSLRAEAQDATGRHYDLRVEYFGKVPGLDWLNQIVVRLHDDMSETGDHLFSVTYRDRVSNRVRVGIGHVGGGPPDDVGAEPSPAPPCVLEFDGSPMTADHGWFWPGFTDLGHFFWEFWAMPGENTFTRYLLSDGYGGAHALLFGFSGDSEPGRYNFIGNIWMGASYKNFSSDEGPAPGEWGHYAVGWDGANIIIYFNGVPVGKTPFAGPRRTLWPDNGSGYLFIGGSDHQNLIGRIAQVRGYEDVNPRAGAPESTFTPETLFRPDGSFLSRYFWPIVPVADLSTAGYLGAPHPGILRGVINGYPSPCPNCPVPRFVVDPTAPRFTDTANPGQIVAPVDTPASAPAGALVFDSFSRPNSTYILGGLGGLGTTEVGPAWVSNLASDGRQPFGILNGRAVLLASERTLAWTQVAGNSLEIRVDRRFNTVAAGKNTGISFRVVDRNNYFFAYTTGEDSQRLRVGYYLNGVRTEIANNVELPGSWQRLRVVTWNDGRLSVYADEVLLHSRTEALLANASGAGLYNEGPGMALTNRWDNFTVLAAP